MPTSDALIPASVGFGSLSDQHLSKLRELYIEQNKSAAEVEEAMKNYPEFPTLDTKFYKYGLYALGLVKKLSLQQRVAVQVHVLKRKRKGKETEVYLSDQLQSQEKIDRAIKRNKKGLGLLSRMTRGPTPELPAQVLLRTPTLPLAIIPILEVPHANAGTIYHFQQLPYSDWMVSNPNSTVQLLSSAPTTQLLFEIYERGGILGVGPNAQAQRNLHNFGLLCTVLANSRNYQDVLGAVDMKEILDWVGADANRAILKAFFAPGLPAMAVTWIQLIRLSADLKFGAAFQSLIEVGFEIHNKIWIHQYAHDLLMGLVKLRSIETKAIAKRLLLHQSIRDVLKHDSVTALYERPHFETMLEFINAGVKFDLPRILVSKCYDKAKYYYKAQFNNIVQFLQPSSSRQKRIDLLEKIGFNFDHYIYSDWIVEDAIIGLDYRWVHRPDINLYNGFMLWSILDHLWFAGQYDVYDAIVGHSIAAKTEITIAGLVLAARSGIRQLQLYVDSRPAAAENREFLVRRFDMPFSHCVSRRVLMEAALSVAAGLGDVAAIASFRELGVDPNASTLLSCVNERRRWYPLMRAAEAKHFDTVCMLIHMGANPESNIDGLTPLSAAIWAPQLLSDTKRLEKLKTIKYLLSILSRDFIRANGVCALTKVAIPPKYPYHSTHHLRTPNYAWRTNESAIPDKEVLDMLLKAGLELNRIMVGGKDLLHLAIEADCNLETVDVLLSYGAQIHSRPCAEGTTMLEAAMRGRSPHRLRIVERLLQSGASGINELNVHSILESALPLKYPSDYEVGRGELLLLLLPHEPFLGLWPTVATWAPILTRLLSYEASDELINRVIKSGANIHATEHYNPMDITVWGGYYTPLQIAVLKGRLNIACQLLQQGADINAPALPYGHTVLQAACNPEENVEIPLAFIQYLISQGANINASGPPGSDTPAIHLAVIRGSNHVLCALLDAGANVHALAGVDPNTGSRKSVLDVAAGEGRLDIVYLLLNRGAQSYKQEKTPYDGAIKSAEGNGHFVIADMIKAFAQRATC